MLFGFNLHELFLFPFREQEARKHFLIGCLIYLAGFFIPILPWLIVAGYNAILIRQVLNGEKPHLVRWENWESLLRDGARLVGIRLIYSSPLLVLLLAIIILSFAFPFFTVLLQNSDDQSMGILFSLLLLIFMGIFMLMMPLSLAVGLLVPAAEIHVIAQDRFQAGLQFREWWLIFKKNWAGFVVTRAVLYAVMMVMSFIMQFLFMTFILICLVPFLMAFISMYIAVIQYVAYAKAYKDGQDKLTIETIVA